MRVLVVNVGSSSLKHALVDTGATRIVAVGEARWEPEADGGRHAAALRRALDDAGEPPDAVGHRVVHGGERFQAPALIDAEVRGQIAGLVELAPLHNRAALEGIDAATDAYPDAPQVACFDTAFHHSMPAAAATYAIPPEWSERHGIRRFGFHGLNVQWCAQRARELVGAAGARRLVVCHVGSGASVTGVLDGRSVDTTMGFTPLEGVVMATRSGSVDPGLLVFLARSGYRMEELEEGLNHRSGLLGLSGHSADLRAVLAAADRGDARSQLAFEVLLRSLAAAVASMTTALGGLDCLVFTAGAGEGSPRLRAGTADRLAHLGVRLDGKRNEASEPDTQIQAEGTLRVLIVAAGEELIIARDTGAVLERAGAGGVTPTTRPAR